MSDEMREVAVKCPFCDTVVYVQFEHWFNDREWEQVTTVQQHGCGGGAA